MRLTLLIIAVIAFSKLYAQQPSPKITITGIVVANDSLPISDVAIVNIRTGKTVRTNAAGYFKTEISGNDSLFVYHISYKKQYINKKENGKLIVLEPEIQEIKQVDVNDIQKREQRNLAQTVEDILKLAPMKKLSGYELHSPEEYFILENGSQTKGFSPFFGPTAHLPLETITGLIIKSEDQKERQKLTSHYKLSKKKRKSDNPESVQQK